MSQGAHAFSDVIRLGGHDDLSNLERGRSEFDSDARVYRRFEQFTANFQVFDRFDAQVQFIRHREALRAAQFLTVVSDHSDGWQDVCPFAFLELENGRGAGGSSAPSTAAPIEGCDWPGHSRKAVVLGRRICVAESCSQSRSSTHDRPQ
jgi:hypothetical protein